MSANNGTRPEDQDSGVHLDHASCGSGVIYLIGWAFNGRDGCSQIKVFFHKDGLPDAIEIPISLQSRMDVIEHFSLPAESTVGFSSQVLLSEYDIASFPAGEYDVVICVTGSDHSVIKKDAGTINIVWPEAFQAIEMVRVPQPKTTQKEMGAIRRMWYGQLGANKSMQKLFVTPITADKIIEASFMLDSDSPIPMVMSNSLVFIIANLLKSASDNNGLIVIFDHNYGGGANVFSSKIIEKNFQNNNVVLRVWYDINLSKFTGQVHYRSSHYDISVGGLRPLFDLLQRFPSFCVQINNLYTWPYIESILDNVVRLRIFNFTKRLEFIGHDHIGICPSLFLLNQNEEYCGVPDNPDVCYKCLQQNTGAFKVFYKQESVTSWRKAWHSVFSNADYIRFFSQATHSEYLKAFPGLDKSRNVIVKGHKVSKLGEINPSQPNKVIRIGVFGFLGRHKGSHVILALAEAISKSDYPIQIHVFGTVDGAHGGKRGALKVHGPYDRKNIVKIWDDYHLDFAFVPSICPETFSLVTAELLMIGARVISFDLGAQAELVKASDNGKVIPLPHKKPVLESILSVIEETQWGGAGNAVS